ncbi:unnamed protein product [Albugo candida]|uniref:Uncharacterized protein n=1 Tax=Albugo candida TaxID=65357 RepID=A0A024GTR4_9STRA|nr:unnamed protein product [Albugo candida]|eukprot:CCI50115.1 unnamed protein product [Albugo candida]
MKTLDSIGVHIVTRFSNFLSTISHLASTFCGRNFHFQFILSLRVRQQQDSKLVGWLHSAVGSINRCYGTICIFRISRLTTIALLRRAYCNGSIEKILLLERMKRDTFDTHNS